MIVLLSGCAPKKEAPAYFAVDPRTAATISGKITYKSLAPRQKLRIDEDPECERMNPRGLLDETLIVNDGALANVFVYVKKGLEGKQFSPATEAVTIEQKGCRFSPHVLGIRVSQTLRVTNSDALTHNIHPQPHMNREWNQSQAEGALALERRFARPELMIPVKCNIHSWMRAYVSAVEHPYFAVTDSNGSFEIKGLPPGDYVIEALHEKLGARELPVRLAPSAHETADFVFPPL